MNREDQGPKKKERNGLKPHNPEGARGKSDKGSAPLLAQISEGQAVQAHRCQKTGEEAHGPDPLAPQRVERQATLSGLSQGQHSQKNRVAHGNAVETGTSHGRKAGDEDKDIEEGI